MVTGRTETSTTGPAHLHAALLYHSAEHLASAVVPFLADGLAARTGRRWSPSALCRALKRLGWPRKKTRTAKLAVP